MLTPHGVRKAHHDQGGDRQRRIVTRVDASTNLSGEVSYWEARIVPKSELEASVAVPFGITVSGQGARVNVGSVDQSVQHFNNAPFGTSAVLRALDELAEMVTKAHYYGL